MTKKITQLLFLFIFLNMGVNAQINLQNGLIAYYDFNGNLLDSTSNNFDLTTGGNPGLTSDRFGVANMAYNLTASNPDFFNGPFSSTMSPAELTLCAWINPTNPFNDQKIAGKTSVGPGYLMGVDSNKLDAEIWDASNFHMRVKSGFITANTWTHVAISYNASGYLKIYINGLAIDSLAASANGVGTNSTNSFTIGGTPWDNYALNFDGKLDDICLYGRQLSDAEVLALYSLVPTGIIGNPSQKQFYCYPNPVNDGVLRYQINTNTINRIKIIDMLGNEIFEQGVTATGSGSISIQGIAQGIYEVQWYSNASLVEHQKLVFSGN